MKLTVRTVELPDADEVQAALSDRAGTAKADSLGITVTDLSAEQRKESGAPAHGVLVTEIEEGPAKQAGVRVGDLVLMLDNIKVASAKAFKGVVAKLSPGKPVPLLVQRQGNPIFLALKPQH